MPQNIETFSPEAALAIAYGEFVRRFDEALLLPAFQALTLARQATLREHKRLEMDIEQFMQYPLGLDIEAIADFWANARADARQDVLRLHLGVRWWLGRDTVMSMPERELVVVRDSGLGQEHALTLLRQLMYTRAFHAAPLRVVPAPGC